MQGKLGDSRTPPGCRRSSVAFSVLRGALILTALVIDTARADRIAASSWSVSTPRPFLAPMTEGSTPARSCVGPWLSFPPVEAATRYETHLPIEQRGLSKATTARDSHDATRIAAYMRGQDLDRRGGFERALLAFSGVPATDMRAFDVDNVGLMRAFSLSVQAYQDWYESLTARLTAKDDGQVRVVRARPEVRFSRRQLASMRDAFVADDGLITNGELLLAFPDRQERNEAVTEQYRMLSSGMTGIVGGSDASWSTVAVWASDIIGRNLVGSALSIIAESAGSNPRYWLSVGNSQLVSDIGPGFEYFIETFGDGRNRDRGFEQFWADFVDRFARRNISYVDGSGDPALHMKNAFKAYYEAMQLHDQETLTGAPSARRVQLLLFANTLVALQEQAIVQTVLDNGMCMIGVVDPRGIDAAGIDYIVPAIDGGGELVLPTRKNLLNTAYRVDLDQSFTMVDGSSVAMSDYLRKTLNDLDGGASNEDEYDPANSGTNHWEDYGQRMGFIFQLFSDYQRYAPLFEDPRQVFGSRATKLNNMPAIDIRQGSS